MPSWSSLQSPRRRAATEVTRRTQAGRRNRFRPLFEQLENRRVLTSDFGFALGVGSTLQDLGTAVATDGTNVYVTGDFKGTVDFDPGVGVTSLTAVGNFDVFVAKYSSAGSLIYAKQFSSTNTIVGSGIAVDGTGNVYTTGSFAGTADFDPGPATSPLSSYSAGSVDAFVAKLNSAGDFVWARQLGGLSTDQGYGIAVDGAGSVYSTGIFNGTGDFDPGAGTSNLTSFGNDDIFVSKLDSAGNFVYARQFGGTTSDLSRAIAVDGVGNVYTTGRFSGTTDFDPGAGTNSLTSSGGFDAFVSKLDTAGNFVYARQFGAAGTDDGNAIAVDRSGNVYTTGYFEGAVDFDPGAGSNVLTSFGSSDVFVSKLNAAGNFVFARQFGGTSDEGGYGIVVDGSDNVYTAGYFRGTVDFDPGAGVSNLTSFGSSDTFVSKLDGAGNFVRVRQFGGVSNEGAYGIALDNFGNVYTTGEFSGTSDFDSGAAVSNLTSAGNSDMFLSKLTQRTVGDRVWNDSDSDGIQDVGEPGVEGAVAELFDSVDGVIGNGNDVSLGVQTTDANGNYRFIGPRDSAAGYYLLFRPPVGFGFTTPDVGGDDTKDSDANTSTGRTALFTLSAGVGNLDLDAGLTGVAPAFGFAFSMGGVTFDQGRGVVTDAAGDVYIAGTFEGTADFDPGVATVNLTAAAGEDAFIAKYTSVGALIWVRRFGGTAAERAYALAVDDSGNIYTTGGFNGTADFDPGPGTFNLVSSSPGGLDAFVTKLDRNGNFLWASRFGGVGTDVGNSVAFDRWGNVYTTGTFQNTADFDPSAALFNLTSAGDDDVFVSKLDSAGTFVWAKQFAGSSVEGAAGVAVDGAGNVYTSGYFNLGPTDFDPGAGTFNLTSAGSYEVFVSKLDTFGNFVWAKQLGGTNAEVAYGMTLDGLGNVYATGYFYGTADFDPGAGVVNLTSAGLEDAFISKLDSNGSFVWARQLGGVSSDTGQSLAVDASGNVYSTGTFENTADFDPGATAFNLTSGGGRDTFVSKFDSAGNFVFARGFSGSVNGESYGVAVDRAGNVYATAAFAGTVDFDPSVGVFNLSSNGFQDIFLAKLTPREIGDRVWNDTNSNGLQDVGEPGVAGAVAELFDSVDGVIGNGDDVSLGAQITDASGNYRFVGPRDSVNGYYLVFRPPVGFGFTTPDVGGDDAVDSDANTSTGRTALFAIAPGWDRLDLDAGLTGASPDFGLAFTVGEGPSGTGAQNASEVVTDAAGNVYVAGGYQGTNIDFDPGPGVVAFTSKGISPTDDIYVAKYTSTGALVWVATAGGKNYDQMSGLALDDAGNVYTTGYWDSDTIDFDPGAGVFNLTNTNATIHTFVWKLDNQGRFVWAKQIGGSTVNTDQVYASGLAVSGAGDVYVAGAYHGIADFDPGASTFSVMSASSNHDAFVDKLNSAGEFQWVYTAGGVNLDYINSVALDAAGSIYLTGGFSGVVDFDPGAGQFLLDSSTGFAFVEKLAPNGSLMWAGNSYAFYNDMVVNSAGEVFAAINFSGTGDVDPGPGTLTLTSTSSSNDVLVLKLESTGALSWTCQLGGAGNELAVAIDFIPSGNLVVGGGFRDTMDFDPGAGVFQLANNGSNDPFLLTLTLQGNFVDARNASSGSADPNSNLREIAVGPTGEVYSVGGLVGTLDFDPSPSTYNLVGGALFDDDAFVWKLNAMPVVTNYDYGDAPTAAQSGFATSYPTTLSDNGARHTATGPTLGPNRDDEPDGQPTASRLQQLSPPVDGDAVDEDGALFLSSLVSTATASTGYAGVNLQNAATAKLDAWIDFNQDGDWSDAGEQVFANQTISAGDNTLGFTVPANATAGLTFARFRVSTAGNLTPTGAAVDGEVEDYPVNILPTGPLGVTFDTEGVVVTRTQPVFTDLANRLAIQADKKVVVVGAAYNGSANQFAVLRYNSDGGLDTSFDGDGQAFTSFSSNDQDAQDVAIQADGKIVVVGRANNGSNYDFAIARFNPNGSLDTTFDGDGKQTISLGSSTDVAYGVAIDGTSRIVVAGVSHNGSNYDFAIARFHPNGSLDGTFDSDGKVTIPIGAGDDVGHALAIQSDGRIVVVGDASNGTNDDFGIIRLNDNGSLDTTFDVDGRVTATFGSSVDWARDVALDASGKIVVAGAAITSGFNFAVARFNSDGSVDTSFDGDGKVTTDFTGGLDFANSVAIQHNGKIVVAGYADDFSSISDTALARYNANGSLDTTFDGDGKSTTDIAMIWGDSANDIAIQEDGNIVVAGSVASGNSDINVFAARFVGDPVPYDFGDTPDTAAGTGVGNYQTLFSDNGPRHAIGGPRLGASVDSEADGQPTAAAVGDDNNGMDDEDGVTFVSSLVTSAGSNNTASVIVNLQNAAGAKLDAWIDFNRDGDWNDAGERIFTSQSLAAANNTLGFIVPLGASPGISYARFRVSSAGNLLPTGVAADGEVEDYQVALIPETALTLSPTSVAENAAIGTTVGTFATSDPNLSGAFTYTLESGAGGADNASFTIDAGGHLKTAASFNFETKNSYDIRVRSTGAGGQYTERPFTVNVTNVHETPTSVSLSNASLAENQSSGTTVGVFSTIDPDIGDSFTYTLEGGAGGADNGSFTIDAGGNLKTAASFDFETKSSYEIRVRSTDAGTLYTEQTFVITVTDVVESGFMLSGTSGDDRFTVLYSAANITVSLATNGGAPSLVGTYGLGTEISVNGLGGTDHVTVALTPDQLGDLTTADILALRNYLAGPTGKTLFLLVPPTVSLTTLDFETAMLVVNDDNAVVDVSLCLAAIASDAQIQVGGDGTDDVIHGTSAADLIFGQGGHDSLYGLDGADCLFGGAGHDAIFGGNMDDLLWGGSGDDSLVGDNGYDRLVGGWGADQLDGGLHDDLLDGGPGVDNVQGGPGYDILKIRLDEAATDVMNGGDNTDTIVNDTAAPVVLAAFNAGVSSVEGWVGNNQPILGTDVANVLSFLIGPSYSMSLSGVPYIDGRGGNDTITGTNGVDNLRGGDGNDTLYGLGGVDTLYGDAGDDSLNGGDGVDYLYGGDGIDTITTGAGRDFVYFAGDLNSLDTITDFALYSDTINLQAYATSYGALTYTVVAPNTTINLANGKKIRLLNWTRAVTSSQFRF